MDITPKFTFSSLEDFLKSNLVLPIDGGLGTELENRGVDVGSTLWSSVVLITEPKSVEDLHYDYYKNGAKVAITCSYQSSAKLLVDFDPVAYATEELRSAHWDQCIKLAVAARGRYIAGLESETLIRPLISASIGPYGAALCDGSEFSGNYKLSLDEYVNFHLERVLKFLLAPEIEFLSVETIPTIGEVKALVHLLEDVLPKKFGILKRYMLSFSIRDAKHLADGTPISEVVDFLKTTAFKNKLLIAVGCNCLKLRFSTSFLKNLQPLVEPNFPLVIYPNSGEIYDGHTKKWHNDPECNDISFEWENLVEEWIKYGAQIIGGCCRVTVNDIKRISDTIAIHNNKIL